MCVDPRVRGVRIGQRLYDARKTLAERLELKGIIIGGRMPGYHRNRRKVDGPEGYLEAVTTGKLRDPVVGFQLRNGFEIRGVLKGYLPEDKRSAGNEPLMVWHTPYLTDDSDKDYSLPLDVKSLRTPTGQNGS